MIFEHGLSEVELKTDFTSAIKLPQQLTKSQCIKSYPDSLCLYEDERSAVRKNKGHDEVVKK